MKKIVYSLLFIFLLVIFPKNAFAVTDIVVFLDENATPTAEYLIFPSDGWASCEFDINDDPSYHSGTPVYQACSISTKNGIDYPVVRIPIGNIGNPDVKYLWFGDGTRFDLKPGAITLFDTALTSTDIKYIGSEDEIFGTTNRIKTETGNTGEYGYIHVIDDRYDSVWFIMFKAVDKSGTDPLYNVDEDALYTLIANLKPEDMEGYDPYTAILYLTQFRDLYESLLAERVIMGWTKLGDDMMIKEPAEAQYEDVYIVWLRGDGRGSTYDIQILTCERREWKDEDKRIESLPKTGVDLMMEGLLALNAILLPTLYIRKRKLEKIK